MNINQTIKNLYHVFSIYTTSDMSYCTCGCIDLDDVKKLASKPLKELKQEDFNSYHGSALYTWGKLKHYKHFLPRVLEVHHQKNGQGDIGLFEIIQKLEHTNWNSWDENEVSAIQIFIKADWKSFVNNKISAVELSDIEYYSFFIPLPELLNTWEISSNETSLKNFVKFFYSNGTELLNKGLKIKKQVYDSEFRKFINQKGLLDNLEKSFFKVDSTDKKYAEQISIVLFMLEQEFK